MATPRVLHINEDNALEWDGMVRDSDGSFVNNAVVTWELKDNQNVAVLGANGNLDYIAASDGKYQGTLEKPQAALLTQGATYYLEITATSGGFDGFRRISCIALYHQDES